MGGNDDTTTTTTPTAQPVSDRKARRQALDKILATQIYVPSEQYRQCMEDWHKRNQAQQRDTDDDSNAPAKLLGQNGEAKE
jgi:hypothetical protein